MTDTQEATEDNAVPHDPAMAAPTQPCSRP